MKLTIVQVLTLDLFRFAAEGLNWVLLMKLQIPLEYGLEDGAKKCELN